MNSKHFGGIAEPVVPPSLIERAPFAMAMVEGPAHILSQVNPSFCRLLGKTREEIIGRVFCELLPEKEHCAEIIEKVLSSGMAECHTEELTVSASRHSAPWHYQVWPVMKEDHAVGAVIQVSELFSELNVEAVAVNEALIVGSIRQHERAEAIEKLNEELLAEIHERQQVEDRLLLSASEIAEKARLLDLSNDAIIVRNSHGRIRYWNRGAEELYGWRREEALNKKVHTLLQTEFPESPEAISAKLLETGRWKGELVQTRRDGKRITVLTRKALDRDPQGHPKAVLEIMTDVTERKRGEEALRHARAELADWAGQLERLVAERTSQLQATHQQLETFVYSIAHDLRAPLRAMQGFSAMLVREVGESLSEKGKDYARRIDQSARFMDEMLKALLDFRRISQEPVELTPIDLERAIEMTLPHFQNEIRAKNALIEKAVPWPSALADPRILEHVLFHLFSNALKFIRPNVRPHIRLWVEDYSDKVRVWVEDNGVGIAPDHQRQIFRIFNRLSGSEFSGTGIGLAIVQKGIERMGGQVGVESTPGQGSRFWFELPKP